MRRTFWKLSAAGNDFVLLAGLRRVPAALARRLCDRRGGVGADGLLAAARAPGGIRLEYRNSDGSAAFCGNGARAAAWWAYCRGWVGREFLVRTVRGALRARVLGPGRVAVEMPAPGRPGPARSLRRVSWRVVEAGVPHAVVWVRGLDAFPVDSVGRAVRRAAGANVDFVERRGRGLALRTYERGVEAETWACGTGAVAAAAAARELGWAGAAVRVRARGGSLMVRFAGGRVRLEGPAAIVFSGEVLA